MKLTSVEPIISASPVYLRFSISSPVDLLQHTLIDKNHEKHDIFFDHVGQNHFIHHYLSAYALGASKKQLLTIYQKHKSYLRAKPESLEKLTRENYRQYLGQRAAYTSYLELFKEEIEQYGTLETIRYWIFKDDIICHFLGGLFHPLIHMGFAIEFNLPKVVAEALAMAACTDGAMAPLFKDILIKSNGDNDIQQDQKSIKKKTVQEMIQEIQKDPTFDGVVKFSDGLLKSRVVLQNQKAVEKLLEYISQWDYKDPKSSLQELYMNWSIVYAASGIRKEAIKLDYFLMHFVTSMHALHTLLPHVSSQQAKRLLSGHLIICLMFYVSRGRPTLQIDLLAHYSSSCNTVSSPENNNNEEEAEENPWLRVLHRARYAKETHVIKTVRALALAQIEYGNPSSCMDLVQNEEQVENILLKAAQVTLDIAGRSSDYLVSWDLAGVGFDETW